MVAPKPAASGALSASFLSFLESELKGTSFAPLKANMRRCPGCGKSLANDAVLCIECGYHLEKGSQLKTMREGPED